MALWAAGRLLGKGSRWLTFALFLIAAVASCAAQDPVENTKEACSLAHLKDAVKVGRYIFRTYRSGDYNADNCLLVIRDGRVDFRRTRDSMYGYSLGQAEEKKDKVPAIKNGTDITGCGRPDMIVSFSTGGAYCCLMHYVFELEPEFKLLATLDARETWPAYFADLDGDGHYYYIAEDWTLSHWLGGLPSSPRAPVVLQWVEGKTGSGYHLALEKMRKPTPTPQEWEEWRDEFNAEGKKEKAGFVNIQWEVFYQTVMTLIYSGHSDLAWKFVNEVAPSEKLPGQGLENFCSPLKTGPYWPDLEPTLRDAPRACANAKPRR